MTLVKQLIAPQEQIRALFTHVHNNEKTDFQNPNFSEKNLSNNIVALKIKGIVCSKVFCTVVSNPYKLQRPMDADSCLIKDVNKNITCPRTAPVV